MGIPDFYIKINFIENRQNEIDLVCKAFCSNNIFRIIDNGENGEYITLECKFDNLVPSVITVYETISPVKDCIFSVETYGVIHGYNFNTLDSFMNFIFSANQDKILSYYKQMGYLAINADGYYKRRNKLRKYYKKFDEYI